jgi:hypothetical protein
VCPPWMGKPVVLCSLCRSLYSAIRESKKAADYGWGGDRGKENEVSVSAKRKGNFVRKRIRTTFVVWN